MCERFSLQRKICFLYTTRDLLGKNVIKHFTYRIYVVVHAVPPCVNNLQRKHFKYEKGQDFVVICSLREEKKIKE